MNRDGTPSRADIEDYDRVLKDLAQQTISSLIARTLELEREINQLREMNNFHADWAQREAGDNCYMMGTLYDIARATLHEKPLRTDTEDIEARKILLSSKRDANEPFPPTEEARAGVQKLIARVRELETQLEDAERKSAHLLAYIQQIEPALAAAKELRAALDDIAGGAVSPGTVMSWIAYKAETALAATAWLERRYPPTTNEEK